MKKFIDFKNYIWDKIFPVDGPSKESLFNIIFLGGIFFSFIKLIIVLATRLSMLTIAVTFIDLLSLTLIYFVSNKINKQRAGSYIVAILINFVLFPIIFLANGAVAGGASSYFILGIVYTILLIDGLSLYFLVPLELAYYAALYMLALHHPEYVAFFDTPYETFRTSYIFMVVSALLVGIGIKLLLTEYQKKSERVKKLLSQVQDLSVKDPLTGVYNRRYMLEFLEKKISQSKSDNSPLSVIMFDIDSFKNLNDVYGHVVGDEVLQKVSEIFLDNCRKDDIVARYGGEEFLLVLPDTEIEVAVKRAEQIRVSISEHVKIENCDEIITISGGVVQFVNSYDIIELIKKVDEKLYIAKGNGRNQIIN